MVDFFYSLRKSTQSWNVFRPEALGRSDACRGRHGCVDRVRAVILAIGFVSRGRLREVLHRCVRGERPTMLPRSGEASPAEGIVRW